ncbi:MAG TPA: tetratricopeptide repeat protein [Alphaproteobacteria bacterium]|nr:tetratricopeptide repeat protein [Alphaproteobacteria bacterium]
MSQRSSFLLAMVIVVVSAWPDGEAAAQAAGQVSAVPQSRNAIEEYNQAFDDLLKRPSDIDASFRFSALAAKLGYYEEAITALERLLVYNSDLPRLKYELGILYYRLGSLEVARTYLAQAGSAADLPPDAQQQIASSLKDIDRRNAVNRLNATLATGLRYQTNANASPSDPDVVAGGIPATLSNQFVKRGDWNAFVIANLHDSYDLQLQNAMTLETDLQFYYAKQRRISAVDTGVAEVKSGPRFALEAGDDTIVTVEPYGTASDVLLGDAQDFYAVGGGVELSRAITETVTAVGSYEARIKRFQDSTLQPKATAMDSVVQALSLNLRYLAWAKGSVETGASVAREISRASFASNDQLDLQLSYSQTIDLPAALRLGPVVVTPALLRIYTKYDEPDPAVDPSERRITREWRYLLSARVSIRDGLGADLQLMRQMVGASLPNFKYNNTSVTFGLDWNF